MATNFKVRKRSTNVSINKGSVTFPFLIFHLYFSTKVLLILIMFIIVFFTIQILQKGDLFFIFNVYFNMLCLNEEVDGRGLI